VSGDRVPVLSIAAQARRKMLVSSVGKGSVVLAAASVPMHTLASTTTRCKTDGVKAPVVWATVSGCHSAVGSRHTEVPVSSGHSCTHYQSKSCWPKYSASNDQSDCSKKFKDIFGGTDTRTCFDIVTKSPTSDKCHWIVAYQNALKCGVTNNFPYEQWEVKQLYTKAGTGGLPSRTDCVTFFKTHMESCA
jgi:hypothetical protein